MENANTTIGLDEQSFDKVKQESNIDFELSVIDKEAESVLESSKSEAIAVVSSNEKQEITKQEYQIENGPRFNDLVQKEALDYCKDTTKILSTKNMSV